MKTNKLKTLSIATFVFFVATSVNVRPVVAQSIADYSVLPANLTSNSNLLPKVLIILDNSDSMKNIVPGGQEFVGGHHPNSRSYQARKVLRDILALDTLRNKIHVGFMEYDIAWSQDTDNRRNLRIEDCGNLTPPEYEVNYITDANGDLIVDTTNPTNNPVYTDSAGNVVAADSSAAVAANDTPITEVIPGCSTSEPGVEGSRYRTWVGDSTPASSRGRLRSNISLLDDDKVAELHQVIGVEPQMPEILCREDQECGSTDHFVKDRTASFLNGITSDEDNRINDKSYDTSNAGYWAGRILSPDDNNNNIPDIAENPTVSSLSVLGTPTFGAIVSAHNYLRGNYDDNAHANNDEGFLAALLPYEIDPVTGLAVVDPDTGEKVTQSISHPTDAAISLPLKLDDDGNPVMENGRFVYDEDCVSETIIILITDGLPRENLDGDNIRQRNETCSVANNTMSTYSCIAGATDYLAHARASIAPLLTEMYEGLHVDYQPDSSAGTNEYKVTTKIHNASTAANSDQIGLPVVYSKISTQVYAFGDFDPNTPTASANELVQFLAEAGSGGEGNANIASNAVELGEQLSASLTNIATGLSSGSGVSVVTTSTEVAGAIVQASYEPSVEVSTDPDTTETIYWKGNLKSYFIDQYGFLREDSATNGTKGKLDGYDIDKAFTLEFDRDEEETLAQRLTITGIGTTSFSQTNDGNRVSPDDITPIWEAGEILSGYAPTNTGGVNVYGNVQRDYDEPASLTNGYRHIFTWQQTDRLSTDFDSGTQTAFLPSYVDASNFRFYGVNSELQAENIIRYIRGEENISTTFRSRTIDTDQYLLGDIVHSSAAVVDVPSSDFFSRFGDISYKAFQNEYQNRRRMVYVGGNDGLLHAFNAGFWDGINAEFTTTPPTSCINCDMVDHELGAEVWAYAPMNLLPHLQFLTSKAYDSNVHIAYVDGPVKTFDVQAWGTSDTDGHVQGWGTILVTNMRLGGGDFEIDANGDDIAGDDTTNKADNYTNRSAYIVMDVTDPSVAPKVIAEITHPDIGFSTSEPTIQRDGDDWFLVFGSGPNNPIDFISEDVNATIREPKLFRYRLNDDITGRSLDVIDINTAQSSFVGNTISHDWDSNETDDAVYFGVIGGTALAPSGNGMYRYVTDPNSTGGALDSVKLLLDTGIAPPVAAPLLQSNESKNWVSFGTGRFYTEEDVKNGTQNTFYNIIEERNDYPIQTAANIVDVTNVSVSAADGSLTPTVAGQTNTSELKSYMLTDADVAGWKIDIDVTFPSDKITLSPQSFADELLFVSYSPDPADTSGTQCSPVYGESFLTSVNIATGVPTFVSGFDGVLGQDASGNLLAKTEFSESYIASFGVISTKNTETNKDQGTAIGGGSAGDLPTLNFDIPPSSSGRTSWRELEIQ